MSTSKTERSPAITLRSVPEAALLASEILLAGCQATDPLVLVRQALNDLVVATHADFAALATLGGGRWMLLGEAGTHRALPESWLAEALDREETKVHDGWFVVPLRPHAVGSEVLVLHGVTAAAQALAAAVASSIGQALDVVRQRLQTQRQLQRLRTILDIAAQWNQTHEMQPLLVQMAEAATRLLRADRASIFLWDRPNHSLVGRPALGIGTAELRIADNEGVAGQVVRSGQPVRVDAGTDQALINRRIDTQLGYTTRTLICVPMRSRRGDVLGVFEAINKSDGNFTADDEAALVELAGHASIALENTQERQRLIESRRQLTAEAAERVQLIGSSPAIEALRSTVQRVAPTELAVLVLGENGTGKEIVSQSIHYLSSRRDHPFIAVNCAALTETLLESELFGHEKGAFTDAHESRPGKFELANGGTLFLDEIGDLSPGGQAKLLRVLEEKVVVRVGGSKSIHTDARVIAATNQDLSAMVRQKRFRQDLYFRLNVVSLVIPPLRERPEDIIPLAVHFLEQFCRQARRPVLEISPEARQRFESHTWPGNVRELRNVMERLAYLQASDRIEPEDLAFMLAPTAHSSLNMALDLPLTDATNRFQCEYIQQAISHAAGNMSQAAERLGLHRSNLYRKMRQLNMAETE
ncbi:MAG TPA: sigma-54-dependent Fis family transcriptional regulator [Pirellulales bacterium]|nr:sigma-54-dependent Fis family transcriptional regulator [Pirellulales bacterium]